MIRFTLRSKPTSLKQVALTALFAALMATSMTAQAKADWDDDHHDHGRHEGQRYAHHEDRDGWYEEEHRGHERHIDDRHWYGGHWVQAYQNGYPAWWWVVDGVWYSYAQPVYPYPANPYAPPVVYAPPVLVQPPPAPVSPGLTLVIPFDIR